MLSRIVECVPNFSEARRPEIIENIRDCIKSVPGINILDQHSDIDHNRTVITFIGEPEAVAEAAFQAISAASRLINLNLHNGEHPRIGATDVVPFIPIRNVTMQECAELARGLGHRVGEELGIPVYLYEEASTRPERRDLENIRRGQYEKLKEEIGVLPERKPDFGPSKLGSAGATVIGARQFLVAFNVFLNSDDIRIAHKIAKAIRNSSGGWHFVKSKGFIVDGRAQVSMNFTNFHSTPLARVVETIRREAERYGTSIHHSELVGLIPQQALADAAAWYLQLVDIHPQQIFEQHLLELIDIKSTENVPSIEQGFLDRMDSITSTPGGASAAALTATTAATLLAKAARISIHNKNFSGTENQMIQILEQAERLRTRFSESVIQGADAFQDLPTNPKLPHGIDSDMDGRDQSIEISRDSIIVTAFQIVKDILSIFRIAKIVAGSGSVDILPEVGSAAGLARGAFSCASTILISNLNHSPDEILAQKTRTLHEDLLQQSQLLENEIRVELFQRGKIHLP